jgi:hypothetical protein
MMARLKHALIGAAALTTAIAAPASAATFTLIDYNGSVANTPAERGFKIAAAYWSSVLSTNSNIRLEIGYNALAPNIIGSTGSTRANIPTSAVVAQMNATGNSALDTLAMSTVQLSAAGGISMITSGYDTPALKLGIDVTAKVFDNDDSANNTVLGVNTALAKALGFTIGYGATPNMRDAQVNFSSNFAFDFDPTDGIAAGKFDFIGVAIHEIGHALGFVSGVDVYDNPANVNANNVNANGSGGLFSTLDLFRYSNDPTNLVPGTAPVRDLSAGGTTSFFSIDGQNQLFGNSLFSTGANYGDGRQASHFKDTTGPCPGTPQLGILDPTFCFGQMGEVTALDLAAFDAMGWNTSVNVLQSPGYRLSTASIYAQFANTVPEPATWAMMLIGFGMMGASLRYGRRRGTVGFAA